MKRISVEVSGSESEPVEINITPKTTAGEILSALNLEGYILTSPRVSTRTHFSEGKSYSKSEVLYPIVRDGKMLIAKTLAEYWEPPFQALDAFIEKYPHFFQKPS
jgi:hypothetical protein